MKILIYRIGSLGDTLAAVPAMWVVRKYYPQAEITLLCDRQFRKKYVLASELLDGSGLYEQVQHYLVYNTFLGRILRYPYMLWLLTKLRWQQYDILVYLAPSDRRAQAVHRDRRFFSLAGITQFVGMEGFPPGGSGKSQSPLPMVPHEADQLLARIAASGLPVPAPNQGCMDLGIGEKEDQEVDRWLLPYPPAGDRPWVAFGPGSKMPSKIWPEDRYGKVGQQLIRQFDVWPVIFGGAEDQTAGDRLIRLWGRGYNAAGSLSIRVAMAAMRRCSLYVGNDTGTMHMAAAVGTHCVGVFSSRDRPGKWAPYGSGHITLRTPIECEGCMLEECIERNMKCIRSIEVDQVVAACNKILQENRAQAKKTV